MVLPAAELGGFSIIWTRAGSIHWQACKVRMSSAASASKHPWVFSLGKLGSQRKRTEVSGASACAGPLRCHPSPPPKAVSVPRPTPSAQPLKMRFLRQQAPGGAVHASNCPSRAVHQKHVGAGTIKTTRTRGCTSTDLKRPNPWKQPGQADE